MKLVDEKIHDLAIKSLLEKPEQKSDKEAEDGLNGMELRRFLQYRSRMRGIYLHVLEAHLPAPAIKVLIAALDEKQKKRKRIWIEQVPSLAESKAVHMLSEPHGFRRLLKAHLKKRFVEPSHPVVSQQGKLPIHTPKVEELLVGILNEMRVLNGAISELAASTKDLLATWRAIQAALTKKEQAP